MISEPETYYHFIEPYKNEYLFYLKYITCKQRHMKCKKQLDISQYLSLNSIDRIKNFELHRMCTCSNVYS